MKILVVMAALFVALAVVVTEFRVAAQTTCFARQLQPVTAAISRFLAATGRLPLTLAELSPEFVEPERLLDSWGQPYEFESLGETYTISSRHADERRNTRQVLASDDGRGALASLVSKQLVAFNLATPESSLCKGTCITGSACRPRCYRGAPCARPQREQLPRSGHLNHGVDARR